VQQKYDLFPKLPVLNRFLAFWLENLEGPLHSVTVAHSRLIKPAEIRAINGEFRLHCVWTLTLPTVRARPLVATPGTRMTSRIDQSHRISGGVEC
jgi:hypothetical protein